MACVYSKKEYIILSKITSEKLILDKKLKKFIELFGKSIVDKKNIFCKKNEEWLVINCIDEEIYSLISKYKDEEHYKDAQKELDLCKLNKIKFLRYEEKRYPSNLKKIESPPIMIYYKGIFPKDKSLKNSVSIVGSRECYGEYGGRLASKIGEKLAKEKKWNISGLALGIDTYGHKGSLFGGGYTGAFIAQGLLTNLYPEENINLSFEIIRKKGFIATEYPIFSKPYYKKFTLRNRLQAGLVDFLIVPEFNEKSGTLSTIEYGLKEKKEVYICSPRRTLERNKNCNIYNKGNILLSLMNEELKEIYSDFDIKFFEKTRIYKIKKRYFNQYKIIDKIPIFKKEEEKKEIKLF